MLSRQSISHFVTRVHTPNRNTDVIALIHELAHIFGAEHVEDRASIMHEDFGYRTEFDGKNRSDHCETIGFVPFAKRLKPVCDLSRKYSVEALLMLANIRIVLVRPRGSGNIGSIARAMKNMGANRTGHRRQSANAKFLGAGHGGPRPGHTQRTPTATTRCGEAIGDCVLVVGTTCRSGLYRRHSQTPREVAPEIVAAARNGKVALIFGPEDHGLSNKDLEHCQLLMTIPTHPDYQSLNVAQAAVICLYELYLAALTPAQSSAIQRAPAEDVERLFDLMRDSIIEDRFSRLGESRTYASGLPPNPGTRRPGR